MRLSHSLVSIFCSIFCYLSFIYVYRLYSYINFANLYISKTTNQLQKIQLLCSCVFKRLQQRDFFNLSCVIVLRKYVFINVSLLENLSAPVTVTSIVGKSNETVFISEKYFIKCLINEIYLLVLYNNILISVVAALIRSLTANVKRSFSCKN